MSRSSPGPPFALTFLIVWASPANSNGNKAPSEPAEYKRSATMSEFRKSTSSRIQYTGLHNLRGSHWVVLRERFIQRCRPGIVRTFFDFGMPIPCVCITHIRR
ncbi:hypothetical protein EDD15DRAFT_2296015 [Pisolithus albus]|nr:hypothetical protein EDD15DRAFT_2296015 [Pisolithus albus]